MANLMFDATTRILFSASMGQIYEEHSDDDGFLYISYSGENTFGNAMTSA